MYRSLPVFGLFVSDFAGAGCTLTVFQILMYPQFILGLGLLF